MASPAVLTVVDDSQLNAKRPWGGSTPQTKRKRTVEEGHGDCDDVIVIKAGQSTSDEVRLHPCVVVSRTQIPLAYLQTATDGKERLPSLFRGVVNALQRPNGKRPFEVDAILIAEEPQSRALFAIEKVEEGIFALCKLHPWVALSCILSTEAKRRRSSKDQSKQVDKQASPWWARATQPPSRTQSHDGQRTGAWLEARKTFSIRPPPVERSEAHGSESRTQTGNGQSARNPEAPSILSQDVPSPEDLLGAIRTHYLESLYISRTPLAYFVKGPLSRARTALKSSGLSSLTQSELLEFLQSYIMTLNMGTKKYEIELVELIRELPPGSSIDDLETHFMTPLKDRIRKSRKRKKISKMGLIPGEEEYVVKWWVKREVSLEYAGLEDTRDSRIRSGLAEKRARETQLQIILILEVLALEAAASKDGVQIAQSLEEPEIVDQAKRTKKPVDLMKTLDVLIDRLCIWESMNLDGSKPSKSLTSNHSNKISKDSNPTADNDYLRDFCTDVVVPYYATRLPELYTSICQKLGGPLNLASSPPALRAPAPKTSSHPQPTRKTTKNPGKPSAATDKAFSRRSLGLTRSATDSQLPPSKRELSGVDLSDIPRHRPTLHQSGRYAQREVDLAAVGKATEAKASQVRAQRKAAAEQELKKAIAALRRPNARMAVKDYVDSADLHNAALSSKAQSRKAKNPVRNPFATASGVQVAATPRINRQVLRESYALPPPPSPRIAAPERPEDPCVPSSSRKPVARNAAGGLVDTPLPRGLADAPLKASRDVEGDATPSRKRAKLFPARRPTNPLALLPEITFLSKAGTDLAEPSLPEPHTDGRGAAQRKVARSPLLQRSRTMPLSALWAGQSQSKAAPRTPSKHARRASFTAAPFVGRVADGGNAVDFEEQTPIGGVASDMGGDQGRVIGNTPAKLQSSAFTQELLGSTHAEDEIVLLPAALATKEGPVMESQRMTGGRSEATLPMPVPEHARDGENIYAALGWDDEYDI